MSDQQPLTVNGNGHDGEREASQAPSSPSLRKRAEEPEIIQREFVGAKLNNDSEEILDADTPSEITDTTQSKPKSSPVKSFEEYLKEDDLKKSRRTPDPDQVPNSRAETSTETKPEIQRHNWHIPIPTQTRNKIAIIIAIFSIVLGIYCYQCKTAVGGVEIETLRSWKYSRTFFMSKIKSLMNKFEAQKQETWIQVLAAVNSTLSDHEPKQPSAIVLLVPPVVTREFSTCFVKVLAEAVNDAHIYRNISRLQNSIKSGRMSVPKEMDPDYFVNSDTVTDIHDDLKEYLSRDKTVIFYDVDRIQREEHLLVFHGFCDTSQAYDKRATYFFVISVPQNILDDSEWTHKNGEDIAQRILNTAWSDALSEDKRPAVISRVLANIILVNDGDSCK